MKQIRTMLVGILGVFLVAGTFATPVYARSFDTNTINKDGTTTVSQQASSNSATTVLKGQGIVSSLEASQLSEGWNSVNGDPNKIVYVKNKTLVSGWMARGNTWYYFDPVTHFMVREQARSINGKEYFFNSDGIMIVNCNVDNSYYGTDGAKAGAYNSKCTGVYTKASCSASNVILPRQEFEQKVKEGKIKTKITYSYGSNNIVTSDFVYVYVG